jgi:hypothetical protein
MEHKKLPRDQITEHLANGASRAFLRLKNTTVEDISREILDYIEQQVKKRGFTIYQAVCNALKKYPSVTREDIFALCNMPYSVDQYNRGTSPQNGMLMRAVEALRCRNDKECEVAENEIVIVNRVNSQVCSHSITKESNIVTNTFSPRYKYIFEVFNGDWIDVFNESSVSKTVPIISYFRSDESEMPRDLIKVCTKTLGTLSKVYSDRVKSRKPGTFSFIYVHPVTAKRYYCEMFDENNYFTSECSDIDVGFLGDSFHLDKIEQLQFVESYTYNIPVDPDVLMFLSVINEDIVHYLDVDNYDKYDAQTIFSIKYSLDRQVKFVVDLHEQSATVTFCAAFSEDIDVSRIVLAKIFGRAMEVSNEHIEMIGAFGEPVKPVKARIALLNTIFARFDKECGFEQEEKKSEEEAKTFSRSVQPDSQPIIIQKEEIADWEASKRNVICYPPINGVFSSRDATACENAEPHLHLVSPILDKPFIGYSVKGDLKCYKKPAIDRKPISKSTITNIGELRPDSTGSVEKAICNLFDNLQLHRKSFDARNTLSSCIKQFLDNDTKALSNLLNKIREFPAVAKQEMYDYTDDEIRESFGNDGEKLDTQLHLRALEEALGVSIFVFRLENKQAELEIPRHTNYYVRHYKDRPCICIAKCKKGSLYYHQLIGYDECKYVFSINYTKSLYVHFTKCVQYFIYHKYCALRNIYNSDYVFGIEESSIVAQCLNNDGKVCVLLIRSVDSEDESTYFKLHVPPSQPRLLPTISIDEAYEYKQSRLADVFECDKEDYISYSVDKDNMMLVQEKMKSPSKYKDEVLKYTRLKTNASYLIQLLTWIWKVSDMPIDEFWKTYVIENPKLADDECADGLKHLLPECEDVEMALHWASCVWKAYFTKSYAQFSKAMYDRLYGYFTHISRRTDDPVPSKEILNIFNELSTYTERANQAIFLSIDSYDRWRASLQRMTIEYFDTWPYHLDGDDKPFILKINNIHSIVYKMPRKTLQEALKLSKELTIGYGLVNNMPRHYGIKEGRVIDIGPAEYNIIQYADRQYAAVLFLEIKNKA